ncbi:2-succinyl-6-hydroxy-2,4-cyclohexadiene-1-carboxylate synthase [Pullulanibacillus pueri]|uniref:Putative 2-succinyl-6-hydroxy-2,4-cyclohexadiene-1-carboxylate synthase n=1 Tax=Pullulanibacillus pueri TaxID=1437324 RepID=A0A8J2ZYZ1_9BACL|nr:2-succinyl-6-hydroxy-2,4-cyclohexadiene-1-carboxylate synthase [Pullulanibacillus pueri]MBM7680498.1 2-succinyl-6-hydroxy-2,4-cyclohexadiene-1-carboxylate synthase [Pullulanibacillus pueri]GGH86034.1 putative 2-succinyl-6-hydroxy-2,4-cyclohexadiene-1-carboxylate synthase [Pullulanibacillus pueri]
MIINVHGIDYAVEVKGEGDPLLLLHGFTGSKKTWAPFTSQWSKRYKTIAIDIIGHGETASPEDVAYYSMESVARSLNEILQTLGIEQTHLLGYSMGGRLALYFALHYPRVVMNLILESASPGLTSPVERNTRIENDHRLAERIISEGVGAFVAYWEKIPLFATQENLPEHVTSAIRKERLDQKAIGLANSLRGMGTGQQPSLWEALPTFRHSVLMVVGARDQKFVNIAERMKQCFEKSKIIVVPHVGHAVHVEDSIKFAKIVYEDFYHMIENH